MYQMIVWSTIPYRIDVDESSGSVSDSITQDNVDVAVHEAAQVLGMSSNSCTKFLWDPDTGTERTERPFTSQPVACVDGVERTLVLTDEDTMEILHRYVRTAIRVHRNVQGGDGGEESIRLPGSRGGRSWRISRRGRIPAPAITGTSVCCTPRL